MGRETAAGTRRGREIQQQVVRERRSSSGGMEKREAAGGSEKASSEAHHAVWRWRRSSGSGEKQRR